MLRSQRGARPQLSGAGAGRELDSGETSSSLHSLPLTDAEAMLSEPYHVIVLRLQQRNGVWMTKTYRSLPAAEKALLRAREREAAVSLSIARLVHVGIVAVGGGDR
ncbi:hypothetical protein CLV56_2821 [Mumia flava]|uniref:Uncharacterized protein n=2 Tax=Mumia flava TaxID=1348852 RepID=A0A2M9BKX4_9ACTN|nr:hypothetical protein CLV56_2821 [Mumia flava]